MHLQQIVVLLNFAYIGSLPHIFFKKGGQLNANWWLTATPFGLAVAALLAGSQGYVTPLNFGINPAYLDGAALCLGLTSMSLITLAIRSNSVALSLWHQNDIPVHIVSSGAYRYIRHPFYAAFLLAFAACFCAAPSVYSLCSGLLGCALLNRTAAREEAKLAQSTFGAEYQNYLARTGRFLPRLKINSHV